MELKRVVITGLGALTPIGNNIEEYWNGLVNGKSGVSTPRSLKLNLLVKLKTLTSLNT